MQRTRRVHTRTGAKASIGLTKEQMAKVEELASRAYNGDLERVLLTAINTGLTVLLRASHYNFHHF